MANTLKIRRKIAAGKSAPASGSAGELAFWKAGTAVADEVAFYVHDGVQFVPIVDTNANLTLPKPGAGAAGRQATADAAGNVSWTALAAAAPSITITGASSITGGGDLTANRTLALVGDSAAPGNSFYYGTDGTGTKGFFALPAGGGSGTVTSVASGTGLTGGPITTTGTIALANTAVTPGIYQGITIDQQGRATAAVDAGYVVGPASSTDNAVARYDTTTGKLIQNSGVLIDDSNNVSGIVNLTTTGNTTLGDAATDQVRLNGVVQGRAAHNVQASTGVMDLAVAQMFTATSAAAVTWSFTNAPAAAGCTVVLTLTNGGAFTQTWPASVKWPLGVAPVLTASGTDVLVFVTHDGGTTWRGNMFSKDAK